MPLETCLNILIIIKSLIIAILIITISILITIILSITSRSRAQMLSWPALYHPLILGTFIPPNQNWSHEIVFVLQNKGFALKLSLFVLFQEPSNK